MEIIRKFKSVRDRLIVPGETSWMTLSPEALQYKFGQGDKKIAQLLIALYKGLPMSDWGVMLNLLNELSFLDDDTTNHDPEIFTEPEYWTVFALDHIVAYFDMPKEPEAEVVEFLKELLHEQGIFFMPVFIGGNKAAIKSLNEYDMQLDEISVGSVQHSYVKYLIEKLRIMGINYI
jgi:hypothetical protein